MTTTELPITDTDDGLNDADVSHCYDGFEHPDGTLSRDDRMALCGYVDNDDGPFQKEVPSGDKCPICLALWKAKRGLL